MSTDNSSSASDEIWLPISGFPSYEVSNLGRVRSIARTFKRTQTVTRPAKILLEHGRSSGGRNRRNRHRTTAMSVELYDWPDSRRLDIHRLVLSTFLGPCPPGMVACHSDGDIRNNRLENLRWDTPKSNTADAIRHGTFIFPPVFSPVGRKQSPEQIAKRTAAIRGRKQSAEHVAKRIAARMETLKHRGS